MYSEGGGVMRKWVINANFLNLLAGSLAIAMGLLYIFNLPQMVSDAIAATRTWGWTVELTGILVIIFAVSKNTVQRSTYPLLAIIVLLQFPPIFLWIAFNGTIVGDGSSSSAPIGHWLWAVPHVLLAIVSTYSIYFYRNLNSS